ncbi:MAG: MotA/TolQ/ExbB proton channel family protein [Verrucomicrobia bacterium]|nr:MotA/TolQ/ExbB proton channel family protein [Verrucomicrobiota bacterium]
MWHFLVEGGPVMFLLVLASIASVTFIIERGLVLRRKKVIPPEVQKVVESCQSRAELATIASACELMDAPLTRLLRTCIRHLDWPKPENVNALETRARQEVVKLERGLVVLEIIVGIAPLLGLIGAIHGLIVLFGDLGKTGITDNAVVAKGIAIALHTTMVGLLVAIPTLIAWSYYNKKVETLTVELESICDGFLRQQYRFIESAAETPVRVRKAKLEPAP